MTKKLFFLWLLLFVVNSDCMDLPGELKGLRLFRKVKQMHGIVDQSLSKHRLGIPAENHYINHAGCQSKRGLFLATMHENNVPYALYTPWGVVHLIEILYTDVDYKQIRDDLLARLKAELLKEDNNLKVDKILELDGIRLPIPEKQEGYFDPNMLEAEYKKLQERYMLLEKLP